uniref:Large ribosomal subunit protein bL17 n=1 Tax=Magnetococcus massalia (strain MO-1) TaxID=451514 RepID=A0A1S7LIC1_MAGMO|nr:50S ribosomal subunit protein L17 [Candidatus Magnetococcus massalia]
MRHRKKGRKLNRDSAHRKAMFRNMLVSLLKHERIETTVPRAKELRPLADKMITLGKRGDLHARRQALSELGDKDVVHKLFGDIADRNRERQGGYTRILKTRNRFGDCAPLGFIELVERLEEVEVVEAD